MTSYSHTLPKTGLPRAEVLRRIHGFRDKDPTFEQGQMTAYAMMGSHDLQSLLQEAYGVYFFQNALVRRFMPGMREMEEELRQIAASILSGGVPGIRLRLTSGGSESLFQYLGEEGYLDYARRTMEAKERLIDGLKRLGMRPWDTDLSILLYETCDVPAEAVVGALTEAGWPCMGTQRPPLVQLLIDPLVADAVDRYLADSARILTALRRGTGAAKGDLAYAD